ncbi:MAG TPA: SMI1/KNR4 family protein [Methylovirgula sp.]|jgi:hypothetical protein
MIRDNQSDGIQSEFKRNPPASGESINRCSARLKKRLPPDYVRFLQQTNGGQGFIGRIYLVLWRVENLVDSNASYNVDEFAPGLVIFGSDGGDEAFAFDMRSDPPPIVTIPFVPMALEDAKIIAPNFDAFMQKIAQSADL